MDTLKLYNLKIDIAKYLAPRLSEFKEIFANKNSPTIQQVQKEEIQYYLGYDYEVELNFNEKETIWIRILDDIIFAFESYYKEDKSFNSKEIIEKQNRGLKLFAKSFKDLWI